MDITIIKQKIMNILAVTRRGLSSASYKKYGIRPRSDWFLILVVFFAGVVGIALYSWYIDNGAASGAFWHVDTGPAQQDVLSLNKTNLHKVNAYFSALQTSAPTAIVNITTSVTPVGTTSATSTSGAIPVGL